MMSESNKQQAVNKLTEIVANFTAMISTRMPDDVVDKLKQLKDAETSSMGKIIYHTMFDNMQKAIDLNRPACQDTGEIMFLLRSVPFPTAWRAAKHTQTSRGRGNRQSATASQCGRNF